MNATRMEETTMRVGSARMLRPARMAAFVAAAVVSAGFGFGVGSSALDTETLTLKTVDSIRGRKITSFDISYVDTVLNYYLLGCHTSKAAQVLNTNYNTLVSSA